MHALKRTCSFCTNTLSHDALIHCRIKFPTGGLEDRIRNTGGFASMMTNWVTNAVLKAGIDPELEVTTAMKPFPFQLSLDIFATERQAADNVLGTYALLVDLLIPMGCSLLTFYFLTLQVVQEKESKLRALMVMMGLDMRYYWLFEWIMNTGLTGCAFLLFWLVGYLYGIKLLIRSPVTSLILLLLWSQCLVTGAMLASCVFSRQLWASIGCILFMLIAALISFALNQFVLFRSTDEWPSLLFIVAPLAFCTLHFLPPLC